MSANTQIQQAAPTGAETPLARRENIQGQPAGDEILKPPQMASLLQISKRALFEAVHAGRIPAIQLNERVFRFHKQTVLASFNRRHKI